MSTVASAEDDNEEKASKRELQSKIVLQPANSLFNKLSSLLKTGYNCLNDGIVDCTKQFHVKSINIYFSFFFAAQVTIEGVVVQRADCRPVQPSADYMKLKK